MEGHKGPISAGRPVDQRTIIEILLKEHLIGLTRPPPRVEVIFCQACHHGLLWRIPRVRSSPDLRSSITCGSEEPKSPTVDPFRPDVIIPNRWHKVRSNNQTLLSLQSVAGFWFQKP